ncbi:MAG: trypsin-like serine protease [Deltaproteobacteria bacterium]|nr:trypsin-like serine protease [Deltaproteobacteria bacterium]
MSTGWRVLCTALGVWALGCAAEEPERLADGTAEVLRGEVTYDHPEIGSLSVGCTGTLVAPNVVISAAHCFGYGSTRSPGRYGTFSIRRAAGEASVSYTIEQYVSYSSQLGTYDVALVKLATAVPASVATPAGVARSIPSRGTRLAVYGYGCTARGTSTDWRKRRFVFTEGPASNNLCPGDSGGPVIVADTGAVLRINSGYYYDSFGTDIFGIVPANYDRIAAQITAWSGAPPSDGGGGAPPGGGDGGGGGTTPPTEPTPPSGDGACGAWAPYTVWHCSADGSIRGRCRAGAFEQEPCGAGCEQRATGEDVCRVVTNCGAWEPFTAWHCSRDGSIRGRCREGRFEQEPCSAGCEQRTTGEDLCRSAGGADPGGGTPPGGGGGEACGRYEGWYVWSCLDRYNMVRCVGGRLERARCGNQCWIRPVGYDDFCT